MERIDTLKLVLKPTHKCNLNCTYCYDKPNRILNQDEMSLETADNIFKVFSEDSNIGAIVWHGGEPMLMPLEFYNHVYDVVIPKYNLSEHIRHMMQSNGTIFEDGHADLFKKTKISLGVSDDGVLNNDTRDSTSAKEIARARMKYELPRELFPVSNMMVVTPVNSYTVIETYERAYQNFSMVDYSPVFQEGITLEEYKTIFTKFKDLFDYIAFTHRRSRIPRVFQEVFGWILEGTGKLCENVNCIGDWFSVHPNGEIQPCGRYWGDPKEFNFGNVNDIQSVQDVYANPDFIEFNMKNEKVLSQCMTCKHVNYCMGGCPNTRLIHTGDVGNIDNRICYKTETLYNIVKEFAEKYYNDLDSVRNRFVVAELLIPYKKLKEVEANG